MWLSLVPVAKSNEVKSGCQLRLGGGGFIAAQVAGSWPRTLYLGLDLSVPCEGVVSMRQLTRWWLGRPPQTGAT